MTNEEKARELGKKYQTPCHGVGDCEFEAYQAAIEMAEWKDEILKCCDNCANWRDGQCDHVRGDVMADFVCGNWEMKGGKEYVLPEKPKFKPFDKVVVKRKNTGLVWYADIYSHEDEVNFHLIGNFTLNREDTMILPFNEETEKLIGTTDEWEGGEE